MKKNRKKRFLFLASVFVAWVAVISLSLTTIAANVDGTYTYADYCSYSYSYTSGQTGSVSVSGDTFTLKATGTNETSGCDSTPAVACTTTLTITPNQNVKITATAGTGTTITAPDVVLGTETQVTSGTNVTFSITASNGTQVSNTLTVVITPDDTNTAPTDSGRYYVLGAESTLYYYLDEAIEATKSGETYSGTVVVASSGTVYHSDHENGTAAITIPSGVTLLLPRVAGETAIAASTADLPYANYTTFNDDSRWRMDNTVNRYLLLTIPNGTTINNNGHIIMGGTIACKSSYFAGATLSQQDYDGLTHSDIALEGTLNMGDNSVLSSIGFITGGGTINTTGSGAAIYQPFVVTDYRGGNYVVGAAGVSGDIDYNAEYLGSGEDVICPFLRYTMQNIQTTININAGNYMYGYCDLYAGDAHNLTTARIIGDGSDDYYGLLNLKAGASVEAKYLDTNKVEHYDAFEDGDVNDGTRGGIEGWGYNQIGRTKLTITGGASLGSLSMTVKAKNWLIDETITMDMSTVTFPVPYNYDIYLNSGDYSIPYSMMLLPGASMTVGSGATLTIGDGSTAMRFMVMDGLFDHTDSGEYMLYGSRTIPYEYTVSHTYPKTGELQTAELSGTAELKLNGGRLTVNSGVSFGGLVQTDGSSGSQVTFNGTSGCDIRVGLVGSNELGYKWAGATIRTLPARLMNGNSDYVEMTAGGVYKGVADENNVITSYSFTLYTNSSDISETAAKNEFSKEHFDEELASNKAVCDNCDICKLAYGSEPARCVCNIFSDIPVSGMWYDYTLTVVEGDTNTVYYHLGSKLFNANAKEITAHTITDGYTAEVTSGGGVDVSYSGTTLTFSNVELTADTVVTVSAPAATEVISVTITWDALTYTYSYGTWNPETHTYAADTLAWSGGEGNPTITVKNESEGASLSARFSYSPQNTSFSGAFQAGENTTLTNNAVSMPDPSGTETTYNVEFVLSGTLARGTTLTNASVGQITVTITQEE